MSYGTRPLVIACATLPSDRSFELVGYQLANRARTELCIDAYEPAAGVTWGCGSNRVLAGGAIDATATHRNAGQPDVVAGALSDRVARVVVRSEVRRRLRAKRATRVLIRDHAILQAIGVDRPFGRYLAEVPSGARAVTAEGLDSHGRSLGLVFAEGFQGPIGQARACYSRPRVTALRLLEGARAGEPNRLRVKVYYPGGDLRSVEALVSGRKRFRSVLGRPRVRASTRYTVTVPLRLPQPGTVGIDVTAEGLPLAGHCGGKTSPRRSSARTLVVRVRAAAPGSVRSR